ncbi:hypothetical protein UKMH10_3469 [Burkholderia pseudomallei]|nr:hypothetical protein BMA10399_D0573 [Burkholderia mallei ATCC 10399]VUD55988.1 hypothetical protein UKMH10_3469 [Burkholderia pseudomallei]
MGIDDSGVHHALLSKKVLENCDVSAVQVSGRSRRKRSPLCDDAAPTHRSVDHFRAWRAGPVATLLGNEVGL